MTPEFAVDIVRQALIAALWLSAPLLLAGLVAGVVVSVIQIATAIQDTAFSAVPRLAAFLAAGFLFLPWMLTRLCAYTASLLGDLGRYAR